MDIYFGNYHKLTLCMSEITSPQRIDKILSSEKTFLLIKIWPQFTIAPKMHGG
jgi:hypothetical protein